MTEPDLTYIISEPITAKGTLTHIDYYGKKNKRTTFWLFRLVDGSTFTAVESIKYKSVIFGLNSVSEYFLFSICVPQITSQTNCETWPRIMSYHS